MKNSIFNFVLSHLKSFVTFTILTHLILFKALEYEGMETWEKIDNAPEKSADFKNFSDLTQKILKDIHSEKINRSTINTSIIGTTGNSNVEALETGVEIFGKYKELISKAKKEVLISTYIWNNEEKVKIGKETVKVKVDPAIAIGQGLIEAQKNIEEGHKIIVKIAANQVFWSRKKISKNIYSSYLDWLKMGLDPQKIDLQIGLYVHKAFGNLHSKFLVVDGVHAVVSGANVQKKNNFDENRWYDAAISFSGPAAYSVMKDFDEMWYSRIKQKRCYKKKKVKCKKTKFKRNIRSSFEKISGDQRILVLTQQAKGNKNNRIDSPQNQAWVTAMRNAKERLYVQSPNINDDKFIEELIAAIGRGIDVRLITSKGFNKKRLGGFIGFVAGTGGHNEHVIKDRILKNLEPEHENFAVKWFGKDGIAIDGNVAGASHAKIMVVDDIAIVGSGNMDTFAWNNSREVNVLIDDKVFTDNFVERVYLNNWNNSEIVE